MPTLYRRIAGRFGLTLLIVIGLAQNILAPAPAAANEIVAVTSCATTIPKTAVARTTDLTIATCALKMAGAGTLVVLADGYINNASSGDVHTAATELRLIVRVNGAVVQTQYNDWVNFAMRIAVPVQAGSHTVTFSVARQWGTDYAEASGNLNVLGVPNNHPAIKVCGATKTGPITTTSTSFTNPVYCSITAPSAGKLVILASANQYLFDTPVEANYRVGAAGVTTLDHSDRFVDTWNAGYDGVDVSASTMGILPVSAGETVEAGLMVSRSRGNGTVAVREVSVIGLFLPDGGPLPWCGSVYSDVYEGDSSLAACSLTSAQPGRGLIISDVSLGVEDPQDGGYAVDIILYGGQSSATTGSILTRDSFLNNTIMADLSDIDQTISASTIKPLASGSWLFHSTSLADTSQLQYVELTDPGLVVIVIPAVRMAP